MAGRAPATIPADFGSPNLDRTIPQTDRAFGATDKEAEGTIVLHIKVLSVSADERLKVARIVEAQLKGQRVGSKDVSYLITGDEVESSLVDLGPVEARIAASVMKRLGMK